MESNNALPAGSVPLADTLGVGSMPAGDTAKVIYQAAQPIEVELPNGMKVAMAKPTMSLSEKVANVLQNIAYKEVGAMELEKQRVKSLLYITHIDGAAEPKIADPVMRAALEQKLGDENLDALFLVWAENFPSVDKAVLKIVKKS